MLPSSAPAKEQAHALVDRMTLVQISALIELFEPLTPNAAHLSPAPFCDELPLDAEDVSSVRILPPVKRGDQPPRFAPVSTHPGDLDTWPASMMSRSPFSRTTVA